MTTPTGLERYRTALVTGASSGIGSAVVRALCARGLAVTAVARRAARLQALADETGCATGTVDLRAAEAVRALGESGEWDVLINNAGVLHGYEGVRQARLEDIDTAIDTNVRAVVHLLHAVLPGMVDRGRGHVVNVGSMAGLYALMSAIYGGTKGAVHMLSRNLRLELQGTGVKVTEIAPGRVDTELYHVGMHDDALRGQLLDTGTENLTPEDIANAVLYVLDTPQRVNVNLLELQPTEQTYGGSQFVPRRR